MHKSLIEIARTYDTDKAETLGYLNNFEHHFGHLRDSPVRLLELGVLKGGSLLMWREYFPKGLIIGLDQSPNPLAELPERVRFYQGSQADGDLLDTVAAECAPDGFDIVIDDAAHVGSLARSSFRHLFYKHLKSGGIYVVEDWGTGYWKDWPDGSNYEPAGQSRTAEAPRKPGLLARVAKRLGCKPQSTEPNRGIDPDFAAHNFGMVGFVKELVDEVAWPDIASPNRGNPDLICRPSTISQMTLYTGHAFLAKP